MLVVCEGARTEPSYFSEIRIAERLSSGSVRIIPSELRTDPLKIVESAIAEFEKSRRAFDEVKLFSIVTMGCANRSNCMAPHTMAH